MSGEDALIGLRLVQYAGAALLLGVPVFLLGAGRPLTEAGWARPLVGWGAAATALGALGALAAQTAVMAGSWADALTAEALGMVALHTPLGLSMIARAAAAGLALVAVLALRPGRGSWSLAVLLGLIGSASFAWSGHAGSGEGAGGELHLAADVLHAVAAAVWLGALTGLTLSCRGAGAPSDRGVLRAFQAFSAWGTAAVATLAATGLVNAVFLVGADGVAQVAEGAWGRLLIGKIALFAAMLAFAASNRWARVPALARAQAGDGDPGPAFRRLRASVTVEALLGLALLAVVAALGIQPPPARI